jgi:hypothetical protein
MMIGTDTKTGCYFSLNDQKKTQELLDTIPSLLEKKKINGKDLPTEVFIKKKCELTNHSVRCGLTYRRYSGFLQAEAETEGRDRREIC